MHHAAAAAILLIPAVTGASRYFSLGRFDGNLTWKGVRQIAALLSMSDDGRLEERIADLPAFLANRPVKCLLSAGEQAYRSMI